VVATLAIAAASYLMLVSRTAAQGRRIEQMQTEIFRLQRENEQWTVEIAEAGAFPRLLARARELGFGPAERVEFVPVSE
jgi:hypothetical protein